MRTHKHTIVVMIILCVLCLSISVAIEKDLICTVHNSLYSNISLGIFASGFLVFLTSIVSFVSEKHKYYTTVFLEIKNTIFLINKYIVGIEECNRNLKFDELFNAISLRFDLIKIYMCEDTYIFRRNKKDKIIDSFMRIVMEFQLIEAALTTESEKMKNQEISAKEYEECFNIIANEFLDTYIPQFQNCQDDVQCIIEKLIKNRPIENIYAKK